MQKQEKNLYNQVLDWLIELWSKPMSYIWISIIIGIIAAVQNIPQ